MKMDHGPKAYTMQKVGIALVGNATGWSLINVQPYASLAVTIITGIWILVQLVKFIVTWVREEKQRKKNEGQ